MNNGNHLSRRMLIKLTALLGLSLSTRSLQGGEISEVQARSAEQLTPVSEYLPAGATALLVIDSYNDFLSPDGMTWPMVSFVAEETKAVSNGQAIVQACRESGLQLAFAPHFRYRSPDDFSNRKYLHPTQIAQQNSRIFADGEFGGEFYDGMAPGEDDIVAAEHRCSSGFAGTDLDRQLRAKGISHVVLIGCISNTCVEATARSAVDLGYYVTVVSDAISAFSPFDHEVAVTHNFPLVVNNQVSSAALLKDLSSLIATSRTTAHV